MPYHALDTSPEAAAVQREVWRRLGPARRLELAFQLSHDLRDASIAAMIHREPGLTRRTALRRLLCRQLPEDLVAAAFGPEERPA